MEDQIKKAEIIEINDDISLVHIGHTVKLLTMNEHKTYTILGGSESNPSRGIISHLSPLGAALLGRKKGDRILIKDKEYKILEIN